MAEQPQIPHVDSGTRLMCGRQQPSQQLLHMAADLARGGLTFLQAPCEALAGHLSLALQNRGLNCP